jgi:hypothetical protein
VTLDDEDKAAFEETFGLGVLAKSEITVSRSCSRELALDYDVNVEKAGANTGDGLDLPPEIG